MISASAANVMKTLGDTTRLGVFEQLCRNGEASVGQLTRDSGVSQPAVSQHLRALREARLVSERRVGRNVLYRASPEGLAPLVDWLEVHTTFWREHFATLKSLLEEIETNDHDK